MPVSALETKPVSLAARVLRVVRRPLKVPAWAVVLVVIMAGVYGYLSGRQNPTHHYVPYVGFPLVMDTTTGKACYSTTPRPSEEGVRVNASYASDAGGTQADGDAPSGPGIPMCGK